MDATTKKFLDWIFTSLAASGKTQQGLAAELGIAHPQVTQLKKGERELKVREVPIIAKYVEAAPPTWDDVKVPIRGEAAILATLARIEGLTNRDIDLAFGVIKNALDAKRAEPEPSEFRGQPQSASRRRVKEPLR